MLSGAAVGTAVLSAALGAMSTTPPAARFLHVVPERCSPPPPSPSSAPSRSKAYQAPVSVVTGPGYLALGVSHCSAPSVWSTAWAPACTDWAGAARWLSPGGVALLFIGLAYTEALSRWGTGGAHQQHRRLHHLVPARHLRGRAPPDRSSCSASPHWSGGSRPARGAGRAGGSAPSGSRSPLRSPTAWSTRAGVSSRSRLAAAYGGVIGLVLGYLLIRADLRLTGPRGRRLKETEEATAVRPEPGRTHALW